MRILGLDIGTTSIGFALIELDKAKESASILRLGVRIFPEARDPDHTPLNQQRRAKRMLRRQLRRRRERRRGLNEFLASNELLPSFGSDDWINVMAVDPYALRAKGLSEALSAHELGRALYHLAKHRHFKERDLAEVGESETLKSDNPDVSKPPKTLKDNLKDSDTDEEVLSTEARKHFVAALRASGQTLGQNLAERPPGAKRRGEHATRAIVEDEFSRLISTQKSHHAALRNHDVLETLNETIFMQRPVFWRKSTLGKCPLMPNEPLCPKGAWLSQERRMLEKVNNLAFSGGNGRPIDTNERAALLDALRTQKSLSWGSARKTLEPIFKARGESARSLRFNLEAGDEKGGLKGNLVEAELAKIFGLRWSSHPYKQELRDSVPGALWQADYGEIKTQRVVIRSEKDRASRRTILAQRLISDYSTSAPEAETIVKLHFPQGWEPYSTEALRRILPKLEAGERFGSLINGPDFSAWRAEHFPQRDQPTGEVIDRLPSPRADRKATYAQREEAQRIGTVRNPTVVRVQNELRKVVNNLISLNGKPDLIRVELARDIGKSKRERDEISKGMRKKKGVREKALNDLNENGRTNPSKDDIEKWLLWKECGEQCPYTGEKIGFDDLFSGNPRFETEHIWPRSKSLDNSFRNKTLCRKDINLAKGNRIPLDYFRSKPDEWQAVKERVWKMVGKDSMNAGKARRFCADSMPNDFSNRQLTDTSYAARQASEFLRRLWPDVGPTGKIYVQPVTGRVTAQLRRRWGLNHILGEDGEKTRADHRHHAIDALVVACADGGYTQKLSRYFELESEYQRGKGQKPSDAIVDPPWKDIRHDAERAVANIVVSHRVRKKVSGPLHLETIYGDTGIDQTTKHGTYRLFVTRKPVERLSKGELDEIVDNHVREIVKNWIVKHGGDPKKAFAQFPRVSENGPEIRKVRLRSRQQLALMAPVSTGYADMSNNHHVAIYVDEFGKSRFEVVPLFEARKRLARKKNGSVVRRDTDNAKFIMSLSRGDMIAIPSGDREGLWVVRKLSSNGQIFLKKHTDATGANEGLWGPGPGPLLKMKARKISIDPIGRIRPAND